jgi:serine/threonine protein kinase
MLESGRTVGRYVVDAQIGQGGMAAVYRVHDATGGRWALKVLLLRHPDVRERFCQEAEIQCRLDHPHIVRGLERIAVEEDPALVMELIEGKPLDVWLLRDEKGLQADRDRIARQMVDAVGYAHAHGLVHRDLKPGNVLIENRTDGPFAKLTDFGLAKQVHGLASTRTGIALGTPRYMAPEQIRDAKRVDARADIWSLGAVLFELYTGRPAFHRDALIDIYTAVTDGAYPDPAPLGVPPAICDAIRGALQVDLDKRFPDCRALLAALGGQASYPPGALPLAPAPGPAPGPVLLPGSRPGEELPPADLFEDTSSSVTLLPLTDPELEMGEPLFPSTPPGSQPRPPEPARWSPPPPPPVNAALIVASPLPVRRKRPQKAAWPLVTWIIAWAAALLLVVGTFVAGMVVLGGVVTVNELMDDRPPIAAPRKGKRR